MQKNRSNMSRKQQSSPITNQQKGQQFQVLDISEQPQAHPRQESQQIEQNNMPPYHSSLQPSRIIRENQQYALHQLSYQHQLPEEQSQCCSKCSMCSKLIKQNIKVMAENKKLSQLNEQLQAKQDQIKNIKQQYQKNYEEYKKTLSQELNKKYLQCVNQIVSCLNKTAKYLKNQNQINQLKQKMLDQIDIAKSDCLNQFLKETFGQICAKFDQYYIQNTNFKTKYGQLQSEIDTIKKKQQSQLRQILAQNDKNKEKIVVLQEDQAKLVNKISQLQKVLKNSKNNIIQCQNNLKLSQKHLQQRTQSLKQTECKLFNINKELTGMFEEKYQKLQQQLTVKAELQNEKCINDRVKSQKGLELKQKLLQDEIFELKQQINMQQMANTSIRNDLRFKTKSYQDFKTTYDQQRRLFQNSSIQAFKNMVCAYQAHQSHHGQIKKSESQHLLSQLKSQTLKTAAFIQYIQQLEDIINQLNTENIKTSIQLSQTNIQLKDSKALVIQLSQQLDKIKNKCLQSAKHYQVQSDELIRIFQSKLIKAIQQSSQFYGQIDTSRQEQFNLKQLVLSSQLEIFKLSNNLSLQSFQSGQYRLTSEIKYLQHQIKRISNSHICELELKDIQTDHLNDQLLQLKQKIAKNEQYRQQQQKQFEKLHSQAQLFKKTYIFIYSQLSQDKKINQIVELLHQQKEAYHQQLSDLINCIYYSHKLQKNYINQIEHRNRVLLRQKEQLIPIKDSLQQHSQKQNQQLASLQNQINDDKEQIFQLKALIKQLQQGQRKLQHNLQSKSKQLSRITKLNSQKDQSNQTLKNQLISIKEKAQLLQKEKSYQQKKYQLAIRELKNALVEEKRKNQRLPSMKNQLDSFQTKRFEIVRQNQQLKAQIKNQEKLNSQVLTLKSQISELNNQVSRRKQRLDGLSKEKSILEKQNIDLQAKLKIVELQNSQLSTNLKKIQQQSRSQRTNGSINLLSQKTHSNKDIIGKQVELKNQKLQKELNQSKNIIKELEAKVFELKKQLEAQCSIKPINQLGRRMSWNEEQGLLQGYEQMIQSIREEKQLLQEQIENLKAKVKRLEANKVPRSYISPPKSVILEEQLPKQSNQVLKVQQHYSSQKKDSFCGVSCILDSQQGNRGYLLKKIDEIYGGKKVVQSKLVYKYTEASKIFAFSSLIPKNDLQNECFVFLFANKTNIFGVLNYKKDTASRQSALMFSVNNQKTILKRPTGDSITAVPVTIQLNGDLNIGNGHLKMKSSSRVLVVKQVLGKYFEQYEKKQMFGKDYWRDDMTVELTQFQIHRIYLK